MYRQLVEYSPDAIILFTSDRFIYVNPAAVQMFGARDATALLKCVPVEFVSEADRQEILEALARLEADSHDVHHTAFVAHTLDGRDIDLEITTTVIHQNGNTVFQGMIRDVTEQNMLRELQQANQEWHIFRKLIGHLADKTLNPLSVIEGFLDLQKEGAAISPELLLHEAKSINDAWLRLILQSQDRRQSAPSPLSLFGNDAEHTDQT
jgi:PAS domain S-box-containing protein